MKRDVPGFYISSQDVRWIVAATVLGAISWFLTGALWAMVVLRHLP